MYHLGFVLNCQVHFLVVFFSSIHCTPGPSIFLFIIFLSLFPHLFSNQSTLGRISGLEEEVKEVKSCLSKVQAEKEQLHEKLNDLEKVGCHF